MEYLPLLITLLPFFTAWLDTRRLTGDIPQKVIDNVAKSIEIREKDIEYLMKRSGDDEIYKNHLLEYINYLWAWIKKHKPQRIKAPKVLEAFIQRNR